MLFDRRSSIALAVAVLVGTLVLSACGAADDGAAQAGAAIPFAHLRAHAGELRGGGTRAFDAQLAALRGHPVVVNQWASWCGPCRFEFPFFRLAAQRLGRRVAFLGVDAQDVHDDAVAFLRSHPVPYPHFADPEAAIARAMGAARGWPTTVYYDARGERTAVHVGGYHTATQLLDDIRAHALGEGRR